MRCVKCGEEIAEGSAFCCICGAKQTATCREVFTRNGLSEADFIDNINKWFQWHPKAANIKCQFVLGTALGALANRYVLNQFIIDYELYEQNNANQYGLVKEQKMALVKGSVESYMAEWKAERPQCTVQNWSGGIHSRGTIASHVLGGLGACNQMTVFILYKFPRKSDQQKKI